MPSMEDVYILSSKKVKEGYLLKVLIGKEIVSVFSKFYLPVPSKGYVELFTNSNGLVINKGDVEKIGENELSSLIDKISEDVEVYDVKPVKDIPNRMWKDMVDFARKLKLFWELNSFNIVRYHGDADGISSLFQLKFLPSKKIQHNAPLYTLKDALFDVREAGASPFNVLLMLDVAGEEKKGYELTSSYFYIFVLDHHDHQPLEVGKLFEINPWFYGLDSSYTAGYLSYEIARLLGRGEEELVYISMAGDKSTLFEYNEEDKKKALALDYAAYSMPNALDMFEKIIYDDKFYLSLARKVEDFIEEASLFGRYLAKVREVGDVKIYFLNLNLMKKKGDFPTNSKTVSALFDSVKEEKSVVVGYSDSSVIMRCSHHVNIDLRKVVNHIKNVYKPFVVSGGGHPKAASIIFVKGFRKLVLNEVFINIKAQLL